MSNGQMKLHMNFFWTSYTIFPDKEKLLRMKPELYTLVGLWPNCLKLQNGDCWKGEGAQTVGTLFQQESKFIIFGDILGAPVIRNWTHIEIPLPQAPLVVDVEEEEEAEKEEEKEETQTAQRIQVQAEDKTENQNTTMVVYKVADSTPSGNVESNYDAPVTRT